jgi:hypothetical protein
VWAYDSTRNSDPDGESNGTMIEMARPVPTPMFVSDLDSAISTSGSKWRSMVTITVKDTNQQPVAGAKVYGTWSYGNNVNCTTDVNGQCSLQSSEFEGAAMSAIGFTVTSVFHSETLAWAYDSTLNSDPDGESNGNTINVPLP